MATIKVRKNGEGVTLKLDWEEAAGLHALLCRVDHETHPEINDATMEIHSCLDDVRVDLAGPRWDTTFMEWADKSGGLLDPDGERIETVLKEMRAAYLDSEDRDVDIRLDRAIGRLEAAQS